MAELASKSS
jgi:hypothetical protein